MTILNALFFCALALGPLVIFHELGHFAAARLFNVRVLRFSIGFGKPLLRFVAGRDRTEWILAAIPLGGFVAMLDDQAVAERSYTEAELQRSLPRQNVWKRIVIVGAGPAANFIVAVVVYWIVGLYGVVEPRAILEAPPAQTIAGRSGIIDGDEVLAIDGAAVQSMLDVRWKILQGALDRRSILLTVRDSDGVERKARMDLTSVTGADLQGDLLDKLGVKLQFAPVIGEVAAGPAKEAGLQSRDRIVSINGAQIRRASELVQIVSAAPGTPLRVGFERSDGLHETVVTPKATASAADPTKQVGKIGIGFVAPASVTVRYGVFDSAQRAATQTWEMTIFSLRMLGKLVTGEVSIKNLSGPITIADYASQSASLGLAAFLSFIGFISISIGLMNLLPIPVLDGGHLLYYFAEIIKGRPPSEQFLQWSQRAGLAVIAGLMSVALFNDISRLLS